LLNTFGAGFSPDGCTLILTDRAAKVPWIWRFLRSSETETRVRLIRWADDEEVATFRNTENLCFSRDGNLFVVQSGNSLAIYDFPFRKPWGLIVGSAVFAALIFWGLARLLSQIGQKLMIVKVPQGATAGDANRPTARADGSLE
jgi:sugar lactone lactonase YvrE